MKYLKAVWNFIKLIWKMRFILPPAIAILALLWLTAFYWMEAWWMKEKIVTVPHIKYARTAQAKDPEYNIPEIVNKVHILESSGGKRDGCLAKDKINGYGYAQHGSGKVWNCFKTHEEVRTLVEKWFTEKLETMSLPEALCYYNKGLMVKDCKYYQDFLNL